MVEALYDYRLNECEAFSNCYVKLDDVRDYKEISGNNNPNAAKLNYEKWAEILAVFPLKIKCLFRFGELDYTTYRARVDTNSIYLEESRIMDKNGTVFVLNAFPQFLYDYYDNSFWRRNAKLKYFHYDRCPKHQVN